MKKVVDKFGLQM